MFIISTTKGDKGDPGPPGGGITVGAFTNTPTDAGLVLVGSVLSMTAADSGHPGGISGGDQDFAGNKTFVDRIHATRVGGVNDENIDFGVNGAGFYGNKVDPWFAATGNGSLLATFGLDPLSASAAAITIDPSAILYFSNLTSSTASPANSGRINLSSLDAIAFRDTSNDADLLLYSPAHADAIFYNNPTTGVDSEIMTTGLDHGKIWVGDGSGNRAAVNMSGGASIDDTGFVTLNIPTIDITNVGPIAGLSVPANTAVGSGNLNGAVAYTSGNTASTIVYRDGGNATALGTVTIGVTAAIGPFSSASNGVIQCSVEGSASATISDTIGLKVGQQISIQTATTATLHGGIWSQPRIMPTSTQTITNTTTGGFIGVLSVPKTDASSAGTISLATSYTAGFTQAGAQTVTAYTGLLVNAPTITAGTITGIASVMLDAQSGATNNTLILLGTKTIPSGNKAIWSVSANDSMIQGALKLGLAGTTSASLQLSGSTSGTISILPQAAAGTFNFNLPTTAGTSGYYLTSGGGSGTAMTWTAPPSGASGSFTSADLKTVTVVNGLITAIV